MFRQVDERMSFRKLMIGFTRWLRRSDQRRTKALGLALLGACAAGSSSPPEAQEQTDRITISLHADDIEYSDAEQIAQLEGNVWLKARNLPHGIGEVDLTSEVVTVALGAGDINARGETRLVGPGAELRGDNLHYNFHTHDFEVDRARASLTIPFRRSDLTLYAQAQRIESQGGKVTIRRAQLTTCDREHPHYLIEVRKTVASPPENRLTLHGGKISLYGVNLFFVPRLNQAIADPGFTGKLDIELPGYSGVEGLYVPVNQRFTGPDKPVQLVANLHLTERQFITGRLLTSHQRAGFRSWMEVVRHRRLEDDITERLLYDAFPEVGAELFHERNGWRLSAALAGGYYRERNVVSGARASDSAATLRVGWDYDKELESSEGQFFGGIGARFSLYGNGESYRTLDFQVGGRRQLWPGARGSLVLRHHLIGGETPFEFDDIDLKTEAQGQIAMPLIGNWSLSLGGRYDFDRSMLRDYEAGLHLHHHCLTWTLSYHKASDRFGIGVNLTELVNFGRPAVTRKPRTTLPINALAMQPLQRQGLMSLPSLSPSHVEPLTVRPSEYLLAADHRPRAPDIVHPSSLRPPPSLRLTAAAALP
ncbi:MAG: hypothetical protein ACUVX8_00170 [Candidatus Zipacnadales bacterium]